MLYAHATVGLLVTLVTSAVVTIFLWSVVPASRLLLWQGSMLTVTMGRAGLVWRYWRTPPALQASPAWQRRFVLGAALAGTGWGLSGVLCFPQEALGHQFFLSLVLCGMGVGSVAVFASDVWAFLAFFLPTMTPITLRLFLQGDSIYVALGSLALVLMAAMIAMARDLHRSLMESLRLRFHNLDLLESLTREKDRAEHASRVKSQFLANMSHEIRTPMNGVLGMTELVLTQHLSAQARHYATQAHDSARALLTLLNDILDLSKIEAGKLTLEHIAFDPYEMLTEIQNLFAAEANNKGLALRVRLHPAVPHLLYGDPYRVRQILTNLVANALKFTAQGMVHIDIQTLDTAVPHQCRLLFLVQDTGIGLTDEVQRQLFQPFMQGDGSMTRQYGGTGLGLAISKQLVEMMGGDIGVESTAGQGATFWFTVCLTMPSLPAQGTALSPLPLREALGSQALLTLGQPTRVLLVEDNPVNQEIARAMLEHFGCQVDLAETGTAALAAFCQTSYAIILMDCQMPDMDGCEATQAIRHQEGSGRHTPIIAVTAHSMEEDRVRCLAAGMDDYLRKPFSQDELAQMIRRWLPVTVGTDTSQHAPVLPPPTRNPAH
ncbi:MAG: response regulator [Candidatus Tectimicrobiota bacterium]